MESGLESFAHVVIHDKMDRAGQQATRGLWREGRPEKGFLNAR